MKATDVTNSESLSVRAEGAGAGTGVKLRAAWMRSAAGNPTPILFRDVNGWAIAEGCVILGKTAKLLNGAGAVAIAPDTLTEPVLGNGICGEQYRWLSDELGLFTVPYEFAGPLPEEQRAKVRDAIELWAVSTNIRFRPRQGDDDYVLFGSATFCASSVGRQRGQQQVWLAPDCTVGNVLHEMGHTVGLWHEHTRADRDVYVEIVWSNVIPEARPNFVARVLDGEVLGPYDYASIMHYPSDGFAIDSSQQTIKVPDGERIGQRDSFSPGDLAAIAAMYPVVDS